MFKKTLAIGAIVLSIIGIAGCKTPNGGKPAISAAYAGDGITEFSDNGKLKWGKVYSAHYVDTTDRQTCKWSLVIYDKNGETATIKSGNYFNAKIKVGRQVTKGVYLKSMGCGFWKSK